jgi:hypothetical protein
MKRIRSDEFRSAIVDVDRGGELPERLSEAISPPVHSPLGTLEPNVELFRGRIHLGSGDRRVSVSVTDPPSELIEIHAAHGHGALTIAEGEALSKWLHRRVLERQLPKPVGWLLRLLRLGR